MSEWCDYYQNPRFLNSSRLMLLDADMRELFIKWIGIKDNMSILDVGCGTGAFTYYLAPAIKNCSFFGVDIDSKLIEYASNQCKNNSNNTFEFSTGDALSLDYEDSSFDIVISHTFLTNICDPDKALREMKRVAKPGGKIASVTTQSFDNIPLHTGFYPVEDIELMRDYYEMRVKIMQAYFMVKPFESFIMGVKPDLVPHLFAESGLKNIEMHSVGRGFSLSDARYSDELKSQYICDECSAEIEKLNNYVNLEKFRNIVTENEIDEYKSVLLQHKEKLLSYIGENKIWEWYGGSNLLMVGTVAPKLSALYNIFLSGK